jgi:hypothetical protein
MMENARVYEEMLREYGIEQRLSPEIESQAPARIPNIPTCCTGDSNDIYIKDGAYVCWQCGRVVDASVYVFYNPYTKPGAPVGGENTITIIKKRGYKSLTHFKEHLRRYMGARFGEYPSEMLDKLRGKVDVGRDDCYRKVQKLLKDNGYRKMYKEIFTIIYALGGKKPSVDNQVFDKCVRDFLWMQSRFKEMRENNMTVRKNMPSMYVVMDLLLKRHGHKPFYKIPYLKDDLLQANVMSIFKVLDADNSLKQQREDALIADAECAAEIDRILLEE